MSSNKSSPSSFNRSVDFAVLLSVLAFFALSLSMLIMLTIMNAIDKELEHSRILYDDMTNFMWKDLINEGEHTRKVRNQPYNVSTDRTQLYGASYVLGYVDQAVRSRATDMSHLCPVGLKGPRGVKGIAGNNGIDGANGITGKNSTFRLELDTYGIGACAPCPAGPPGLPGYKGIRGLRGPNGNKGTRGHPGDNGSIGEQGLEGNPGLPGPLGVPGERGAPGEDRVKSMKGAPGPRGEMGLPGIPGEKGIPGERGEDTKPGPAGLPGPMGPTGEAGSDGPPGNEGKTGKKGNDAKYCPCPDRYKGAFASGARHDGKQSVSEVIGSVSDGAVSDGYRGLVSADSIPRKSEITDTNGSGRIQPLEIGDDDRARPSSITSEVSTAFEGGQIARGPIATGTTYDKARGSVGGAPSAIGEVYQVSRDRRARRQQLN